MARVGHLPARAQAKSARVRHARPRLTLYPYSHDITAFLEHSY